MDVNAGAEKTNVEGKHLAAVLAPKINRAPVPKSLLHLQDLLAKEKGKSVFEAKVAKDDADIYVNFNEMKQMVDSEKNPLVSDENQSAKWKSLNQKLTIYDKIINNNVDKLGKDAEGNDVPEELIVVRRTLGEIPGFAEAIAIGTGGKMSIEQVQKFLAGTGTIPTGLKKSVGEMIGRFIGDDELRRRLEKSLSTISDIIPPEDSAILHDMNDLVDEARKAEALTLRKQALEASQARYKGLSSIDRKSAENLYNNAEKIKKDLPAGAQPGADTVASINVVIEQLKRQIEDNKPDIANLEKGRFILSDDDDVTRNGQVLSKKKVTKDDNVSQLYVKKIEEQGELSKSISKLESLKNIYSDTAQNDLLQAYSVFKTAEEDIAKLDPLLKNARDAQGKYMDKVAQRNKYADKYKRKLERTLSEEMKRYWNDVKMVEAAQTAEAEANEKKEVEETAKAKAEVLLDKYLHLSFMKYKNGKVVGWDDNAIKNFMHKDMLSQSPAQLARTFIERIDNKSGGMPPQYQDEIAQLFKDMGVGKGVPPLTFDKVMEKIGQKNFEEFAAKKVPDMLGYAWARGYYFDRMKLKPHEARFLQEAYNDPEFFKTAMKDRDDQIKLAQGLLKDGVLSGLFSPEKVKELLGKDWTEGGAKLLKVLAVGAGAYVLGGGLMYTPFASQIGVGESLKLGGAQALSHLKTTGMIAGQTLVGASKLGNAALQGVLGNATINSLNPQIMAPHKVAALGLDPTKTGPEQAGGILQKLSELSRAAAKPVMAPDGQIFTP